MAFQAISMTTSRAKSGVRLRIDKGTVVLMIASQTALAMRVKPKTWVQPMWDPEKRQLLLTVPSAIDHPSVRRLAKVGATAQSVCARWPWKGGLSFVPAFPPEMKSVSLTILEVKAERLVVKIPEKW